MKIFFSKKQFAKLVRLTYLGHWMVNATKTGDEIRDDYEEVYHYILGFAKEFGMDELVTSIAEDNGKVYASRYLEMEDEVDNLRNEYNTTIFREELIDHLVMRDILSIMTWEEFIALDPEERFTIRMQYEESWAKEFEEHSLERFVIK